MNNDVIIVGLTGQSGAGKTTVSQVFKKNGFGIINCDELARKVTFRGSPCNKELAMFFPSCFDKQYELNRAAMARIVFSDMRKLELLNSVIFGYILKKVDEEIERMSKNYKFILLDAPTLFEAKADKLCDVCVAVVADMELRLSRIIDRDGIDREIAMKRFAAQHDTAFFRKNCEYVIDNSAGIEIAAKETQDIIDKIKVMTTNG